jgi:EAL domain-containing protein (putative c-di-GMP-specific phosphodiesterase class I)
VILSLPQNTPAEGRPQSAAAKSSPPARVIDLATERKARQAQAHLSVGEIWQALQDERVINTYQGQFDMAKGQLISAEALVRLTDYDGGLILPDRFIDAAEASEVIVPLGRVVVIQACGDLALARARGLALTHISVNLSVRQLVSDAGFANFVTNTLKQFGLVSGDLVFELTERLALDEDSDAAAQLFALVNQGINVVLDDIGMGYASLDCIQRLPLSGFKLDRALIDCLPDCPKAACLTRHLIAIADEMNMTLVAEGIETEEQRRCLIEAGCTLGQGFLFARPVLMAELAGT